MSLTLHHLTSTTFLRGLKAVDGLLDKASAHGGAEKLLEARLAPDMFPLARQVQLVSDHAKGCMARLAGVENPKYEDGEKTIPELKARLAKTMEFVKGIEAHKFEGAETRDITLPARTGELKFKGIDYALNHALPNFYFHYTTAYDVLRAQGVQIGKRDFIGNG